MHWFLDHSLWVHENKQTKVKNIWHINFRWETNNSVEGVSTDAPNEQESIDLGDECPEWQKQWRFWWAVCGEREVTLASGWLTGTRRGIPEDPQGTFAVDSWSWQAWLQTCRRERLEQANPWKTFCVSSIHQDLEHTRICCFSALISVICFRHVARTDCVVVCLGAWPGWMPCMCGFTSIACLLSCTKTACHR
jgi:hypothetical protein